MKPSCQKFQVGKNCELTFLYLATRRNVSGDTKLVIDFRPFYMDGTSIFFQKKHRVKSASKFTKFSVKFRVKFDKCYCDFIVCQLFNNQR